MKLWNWTPILEKFGSFFAIKHSTTNDQTVEYLDIYLREIKIIVYIKAYTRIFTLKLEASEFPQKVNDKRSCCASYHGTLVVLLLNCVQFFCDSMNYTLPVSSVYGISQARILEGIATPFSKGSSWPRDRTWGSCICTQILYHLSHQVPGEAFNSSSTLPGSHYLESHSPAGHVGNTVMWADTLWVLFGGGVRESVHHQHLWISS